MKKILFVASEAVPFIKTGGLADVVGALPKCFDKENFDVRVIIPKYLCMKEEYKNQLQYVTHFYMDIGYRREYVGIMQLVYEGVQYYFIDNEYYFSGYQPYGDIRFDIEKFAFFSKAALSILPVIDFRPDLIHCHDWQTGLIPVYLKDKFQEGPFYQGIKTVMTIHNLKFQGTWDIKTMRELTGLPAYFFTPDKLEAYKDANMLKGGLVYADAITTVSNTYAEEIKTEFYGENLDGLMRARAHDLRGIVNGLDYDEWNPETDKMIAKNFNAKNFRKEAALSILPVIDFRPDLIHCHDWQTGLIPVYLKDKFQEGPFYQGIKTVMTIHNLKFQGTWDIKTMRELTGLPAYFFTPDKLEAYKDANMLKGGLVYADAITTVSNTYAEEIKTEFYGENLDGLMRARAHDLRGIVNGLDYDEWNPETDKMIAKNFNAKNFRKEKVKNKVALQRELGLNEDPKAMMIGVVSRLTDQKGFDLVAYIMDELCQDNVQIVVLGTGEERYENMFRHFAWKYQGKVSANIFYDNALSHRIYASCDAFLMPSLFEPCGLSQLMSLRYGTLPIVRETGGLKDTVEPYNEFEGTGTGFSFTNYNAHEMLATIRYAEGVYYDKKREWNKLVDRAMAKDFSWSNSAKQYEEMYNWLIGY